MDNKKIYDKPVSYRLPSQIKNLITILSEKLLISKTAVITLAILSFAEKHGIERITKEKDEQ